MYNEYLEFILHKKIIRKNVSFKYISDFSATLTNLINYK